MSNIEDWSFLWENPENYLIVTNFSIFPEGDIASIFEKSTRTYYLIEDDELVRLLIRRMRQVGVQCIESQDFHPEPSEATKIMEDGLAAGLSREEINRRLKQLR
jgi:hypothetical protein